MVEAVFDSIHSPSLMASLENYFSMTLMVKFTSRQIIRSPSERRRSHSSSHASTLPATEQKNRSRHQNSVSSTSSFLPSAELLSDYSDSHSGASNRDYSIAEIAQNIVQSPRPLITLKGVLREFQSNMPFPEQTSVLNLSQLNSYLHSALRHISNEELRSRQPQSPEIVPTTPNIVNSDTDTLVSVGHQDSLNSPLFDKEPPSFLPLPVSFPYLLPTTSPEDYVDPIALTQPSLNPPPQPVRSILKKKLPKAIYGHTTNALDRVLIDFYPEHIKRKVIARYLRSIFPSIRRSIEFRTSVHHLSRTTSLQPLSNKLARFINTQRQVRQLVFAIQVAATTNSEELNSTSLLSEIPLQEDIADLIHDILSTAHDEAGLEAIVLAIMYTVGRVNVQTILASSVFLCLVRALADRIKSMKPAAFFRHKKTGLWKTITRFKPI